MLDGADVLLGEVGLTVDLHLGYLLVARAFLVDRHGQHLRAVGRLDPVALLPRAAGELHGIQEDEDIRPVDHAEVADPGQVGRLHDGDRGHAPTAKPMPSKP
jgi:hypothetical protein